MNKIENKGFILKPEFYSQEEWCELYLQLIKNYQKLKRKINEKDNIINGIKQEIERLLEREYAAERFAKENGFNIYLPSRVNLEFFKNKIKELEGDNK